MKNICQKLKAGMDSNGNSRNLWVIYNYPDGNIVAAFKEYYCKPKECEGLIEVTPLSITPKEYRSIASCFKDTIPRHKGN
jgi:hypothetical protein